MAVIECGVPNKYTPNEMQDKTRLRNFTYHRPGGDQGDRYTEIRTLSGQYADVLNRLCPASRELSLAMTKLEEVVFWANAAIARNEVEQA